MDIWVDVNETNALRIVKALDSFGFGADAGTTTALFLTPNQVIRMGNPPLRIEILTGVSGVIFQECFARRVIDEIDGVPVNILNLDDLKANKAASGRLKDLNDLANLP
jgi:hypothetical protein